MRRECINPRVASRLRVALPDCLIATVRDLAWSGLKDHHLIRKIGTEFDVFVTIDKGFEFQHDLTTLSFGIVVGTTANNQMRSWERLIADLANQIRLVAPGRVVHVVDPLC